MMDYTRWKEPLSGAPCAFMATERTQSCTKRSCQWSSQSARQASRRAAFGPVLPCAGDVGIEGARCCRWLRVRGCQALHRRTACTDESEVSGGCCELETSHTHQSMKLRLIVRRGSARCSLCVERGGGGREDVSAVGKIEEYLDE